LAAVAIENASLYEHLKDVFYIAVYTLAETIEKRDPYIRKQRSSLFLFISKKLDGIRPIFTLFHRNSGETGNGTFSGEA
jgi:hypothetical protein